MIVSVGRMMRKGGGGLIWPAGMKEHIKAWYDPKKQGMTNFDVIEAYVEDFTKWAYRNYRGTAKITNNTIVITNVVEANNIVEDDNEPYSDLTISVTGVTENKYLIVRQGRGKPETHIKKDGVYTFKDNNLYFGFGVSVIGECNITITQLPTSILKDFSGNGNHAYLYGGKGKLNSGMGVYQTDFTTWSKTNFDVHPEYIIATNGNNNLTLYGVKINSINVEIKGYNDKVKFLRLGYNNNDGVYKELNISNDGIYTIPGSSLGQEGRLCSISLSLKEDTKITITQIPDYPDQLCYDGKMYAVAYDMPILTDYTVMAERTWFENRNIFLAKGNITTEAKYAFIFERFKPDGVMAVQSFGAWNDVVSTTDSCISYLTKNKYNGIDIRSGIGADDDMLSIGGALNKGNIELTSVCCHGAIIVADRSFTEEEINWLKDNLFRK